jgi:hypothetical protein
MQYSAGTEDVISLLTIPQNSRQVVDNPRVYPARQSNCPSQAFLLPLIEAAYGRQGSNGSG